MAERARSARAAVSLSARAVSATDAALARALDQA